MKLSELKQIIKEELRRVLKEDEQGVKNLISLLTQSKNSLRKGGVSVQGYFDQKDLTNLEKLQAIVTVFGSESYQWPNDVREYAIGSLEYEKNKNELAKLTQKAPKKPISPKVANSVVGGAIGDTKLFPDDEKEIDPAKVFAGNDDRPEHVVGSSAIRPPPTKPATAAAGGSGPDSLASQGAGGFKCNNAVIIQKASLAALEKLKVKYRIDDNITNTIKRRISDGKLGNTTLDIMVKLSGGALNPTDYPLNNMQSFQKACKLDQKTIATIVQNINTLSDAVKNTLVSRTTVTESNYKKMLKKAILEELKKIS